MRFRIRLVRSQVAERVIRATDEEAAIEKIRADLAEPYGLLGSWDTMAVEIDSIESEPTIGSVEGTQGTGPMLLSVKDAAATLGISTGMMYQLLYGGEIEGLRIGRRRFVSREALARFIAAQTSAGL